LSPDAPGTPTIGDYLAFIDCDAFKFKRN
jgi:hypothetical protein